MGKRDAFRSEADLCAAFCKWIAGQGWIPYAETGGFDVLAVSPLDGVQVGIQAKLGFTIEVINQALPPQWSCEVGPDFRAILVPGSRAGARDILQALGLTLIEPDVWARGDGFKPMMNDRGWAMWHYWNPERRVALPSYVPDVVAGASGPAQLTEWKIKALRVVAVLELRGHLTRKDFSEIDHRRWTGPGCWLVPGARPGEWVAGPRLPDFKSQHPVVYPQLLEEMRARKGTLW